MATLSVLTTAASGQDFWVRWRSDQGVGLLPVQVIAPVSDRAIAAELAALHDLLVNQAVTGQNRTGDGLRLIVSRGAIRKLRRDDSTKDDLYPYAHFLRTRFAEATVQVSKQPLVFDAPPAAPLVVAAPGLDSVTVPGVGAVAFTGHALERYREYSGAATLGRAWRSLRRVLLQQPLRDLPLPPHVRLHKARRYRDPGRWLASANGWEFALARRGDLWFLVTVYRVASGHFRAIGGQGAVPRE